MADISSLDYRQLRVFDTLIEERSVTKTAHRLGLTQPTVSAVLKNLRLVFDDALFVREQRGVTPTVKAEFLAPQVRDVLFRIETLGSEPVFEPAHQDRLFSIVARDFAQVIVIAPFIANVLQDYPRVHIAIHALPMAEAVERMASGAVDLAISSLRYAPERLKQRLILKEPYVCAVAADSALAKKTTLTRQDLETHSHVSASALSMTVGDPVDDLFKAAGIRRDVRVAVDGYLLVPRMLQGTEFIAVLPESLVRTSYFPLRAFPMPVAFPDLSMALLWNGRVHNEPGNCWLRDQLVQFLDGHAVDRTPVC